MSEEELERALGEFQRCCGCEQYLVFVRDDNMDITPSWMFEGQQPKTTTIESVVVAYKDRHRYITWYWHRKELIEWITQGEIHPIE